MLLLERLTYFFTQTSLRELYLAVPPIRIGMLLGLLGESRNLLGQDGTLKGDC